MASSIACVQPAVWGRVDAIRGHAVEAGRRVSVVSARMSPSVCRVRSNSHSEFLGSGLHSSSSSVVFNLDTSLAESRTGVLQRRRGQTLVVRGLFGLGVPELAVIAGVAALVFGPKKLPEIGKSLGKTVKSFQEAAKEFETEVKTRAATIDPTEPDSDKKEKSVTPTSVSSPSSTSSSDKDSA